MSDELADVPLLEGVAPGARRALLDAGRAVLLPAGEALFHAGAAPGPLYVVASGRVQAADAASGAVLRTNFQPWGLTTLPDPSCLYQLLLLIQG